MPSVELLALDLMDTVVLDPFFARLPGLLQRSSTELMQLLDPQVWREFELGAIDEASYLQRLFNPALPAPPFTAQEVRWGILEGYAFVEGMEPLLGELQRAGQQLVAFSNYTPWVLELRRALALDRFFAGYVVSYMTGARKPDPQAYAAFCQRAGVPPERCLLVDDRQQNIEAAERYGLSGLLFTSAATLRSDLQALRLL